MVSGTRDRISDSRVDLFLRMAVGDGVLQSCIEIAQAVIIGHWAGLFYHLVAAILFGVAGLLFVTSSQA
jgi:hypothetical protein